MLRVYLGRLGLPEKILNLSGAYVLICFYEEYRKVRKCKVIANPNLKTIDYCNQDILDQCEDLYHFELAKLSKSKEECIKINFLHKKAECLRLVS